jgi:hypothetical protein
MQPQQGQAIQVTWQTREEKEEGQQGCARKEHLPPLQKVQCRKPHPINPDKCMWNKIYKGYHFKSICDRLKVAFKPHHKFTVELGGYADKEDLESK